MTDPRCAVGFLTWNGERDAARCARSVLAQTEPNLDICWMDNASEDATRRRVETEAPGFPKPVVLERNTGFCEGHNRAFAATSAPYYLALNQDAELAPDYAARLCDWMDAEPKLAIASGLILEGEMPASREIEKSSTIYSAGVAMGRGRFPFELRMGERVRDEDRGRRLVPAVTGAAMLIRRAAMAEFGEGPRDIFPPEFFAYFEEIDLALRAAQAGRTCGVDGSALAWHAARGRGGAANATVRAHYFKNHWLVSLRNDSWSELAAEAPHILKGELTRYFPQYVKSPKAAAKAVWLALRQFTDARSDYNWMDRTFPASRLGRREFYDTSGELLRRDGGT